MQPKTTAKDFFLYLASFAALYASAISLISLLFTIINRAFPDSLNSYYFAYDPYTAGMRAAIATLVIIFPVYLFLAAYLNRYLRANPDRKEISVRKWLTYLTIFITSITLVTDLIVLVNTFLGGEITSRFTLKVVAVLFVAGSVLWYYLYDLKKSFAPEMPNRSKLIISVASVAVLASLITGFAYIGSPMKARFIKLDNMRISDLQTIQSQLIYSHWQQKASLPDSLEDLTDPISGFSVPNDPETGADYEYVKTGHLSFKLCATFDLASEVIDGDLKTRSSVYYPGASENENWKHEAGKQCFDRTIDPELYRPFEKDVRI
jgi:hypothetical protein